MANSKRDPSLEQFWRTTIAAWQTSNLSIRDFCRRRQVSEPSFHHWRRELRQRDAVATTRPTSTMRPASNTQPATPTFVPVTVVRPAPEPVGPVEIRCPSGHVVMLVAADADTLRQLFAALAPVHSC